MDELPLSLPPAAAPSRPEPAPTDPDQKRRTALAAGLALLWAAFTLLAQLSGALNRFEEPFLDWRQSFSVGSAGPTDQLALAAIDTIPTDRPWPWSRFEYSLVLRALIDYHPQSVVFDLDLHDRDLQHPEFDDTFSSLVERSGAVLFASTLLNEKQPVPPPEKLPTLISRGNTRLVARYNSGLWPLETFAGKSPIGAHNADPESGLHLRRLPLVFLFNGQAVPSLVLQAAATYLGADLTASDFEPGRAVFLRRADGHLLRTIPVDMEGRLRVRYHRGATTSWQAAFDNVMVYDDLLRHGVKPDHDPRALNQRQVWIGRIDPYDHARYQTPVGELSRTEVELQAMRTILNQDYVRPLPPFILSVIYLGAAIGGAVLVVRLGRRTAAGLFVLVGASWLALSVLVFRIYNVILPLPSFLLLLLPGAYVVGVLAALWDLEPEEDPRQTKLELE